MKNISRAIEFLSTEQIARPNLVPIMGAHPPLSSLENREDCHVLIGTGVFSLRFTQPYYEARGFQYPRSHS